MSARKNNAKGFDFSLFFKKHWWKIGFSILLIGSVTFIGYNKYLDQQNVNNMKQLLADFEQLERDVEAETGEELTIEASCEGVGKFSESYACYLYLKNSENTLLDYSKLINDGSFLKLEVNRCRIIDGKDAKYLNFYSCTMSVREANINKAEEIFYKYDTSPGESI